jgi:hypothetical protein
MCAARRSYHLGTVAAALEICAAGVPHNATSSWRFWQRRHARHSPGIFACPAFQREVQQLCSGAHELTVFDLPPVRHSSGKVGVSFGLACGLPRELGRLSTSSAGAAHASAENGRFGGNRCGVEARLQTCEGHRAPRRGAMLVRMRVGANSAGANTDENAPRALRRT